MDSSRNARAVETEIVVNAAGEWVPRIGEMVGLNISLVPLMHQYMLAKPVPGNELPKQTPVVHDPDNLFYLCEEARGFLIGGFETGPKAWSTRSAPWEFTQQLLPPEWDLFQPVLESAHRRVPILEQAEITKPINGPEAITPDGHYAPGPVPTVQEFWVAGAGGAGRVMAEWIIAGEPSIDATKMNIRRSGGFYRDVDFVTERGRKIYRHYFFRAIRMMRTPRDAASASRRCTERWYRTTPALGERTAGRASIISTQENLRVARGWISRHTAGSARRILSALGWEMYLPTNAATPV